VKWKCHDNYLFRFDFVRQYFFLRRSTGEVAFELLTTLIFVGDNCFINSWLSLFDLSSLFFSLPTCFSSLIYLRMWLFSTLSSRFLSYLSSFEIESERFCGVASYLTFLTSNRDSEYAGWSGRLFSELLEYFNSVDEAHYLDVLAQSSRLSCSLDWNSWTISLCLAIGVWSGGGW
jgi:hypothetical protein